MPRLKSVQRGLVFAIMAHLGAAAQAADADQPTPPNETQAQRGYRLLTTKCYLPPDFDQEVFDELWKTWEEPLRSQAAEATPAERRKLAFDRYGLTESPERPGGVALQYVDDGNGGWVMNCLACHGGKVAGQAVPGLPNSLFALETLTEEVRLTKERLNKPFGHMDTGLSAMPLGGSNGVTNAVMFGVILLAYRDEELNVHRNRVPPKLQHHDHDAPPWWNIKHKTRLYSDGFVAKGHRPLMQFLLLPRNGPEKFHEWEQDYADILAWIESLEPPRYPFEIDRDLAAEGEGLFVQHCSQCHGTYGAQAAYPEVNVPIDELGTDRIRLDAISVAGRRAYHKSWFNDFGEKPGVSNPAGYVAPPLFGVWASAPYLHNGSVPTLWHLLNSGDRPPVWLRSIDGYDRTRVGLEVTAFDEVPSKVKTKAERRRYYDARQPGKSAAGHPFADTLDDAEKRAVLEYLKTL